MKLTLLLVFLCCAFFNVGAAETEPSGPGGDDKLPLSDSGKRRIQKNLSILEQNLKDVQTNVEITDKNIGTIKAELDELTSLEAEHIELRKKFSEYLSSTNSQMQKNEKEIARIEAYEKQFEAAIKKMQGGKSDLSKQDQEKYRGQVDKARMDKLELTQWRQENAGSNQRVTLLLKEVSESLGQVQARKAQLSNQVKSWQQRRREFQALLTDYRSKKNSLEKLMAERGK